MVDSFSYFIPTLKLLILTLDYMVNTSVIYFSFYYHLLYIPPQQHSKIHRLYHVISTCPVENLVHISLPGLLSLSIDIVPQRYVFFQFGKSSVGVKAVYIPNVILRWQLFLLGVYSALSFHLSCCCLCRKFLLSRKLWNVSESFVYFSMIFPWIIPSNIRSKECWFWCILNIFFSTIPLMDALLGNNGTLSMHKAY